MRIITGVSIASFAIAAASPALAKEHTMPADKALEFGQQVAHESYVVSEDAKGEDGVKAVDGPTNAAKAPTIERGAKTVEKPDTSG